MDFLCEIKLRAIQFVQPRLGLFAYALQRGTCCDGRGSIHAQRDSRGQSFTSDASKAQFSAQTIIYAVEHSGENINNRFAAQMSWNLFC